MSWADSRCPFLGHRITAEGAAPITRHVEAVQNFSRPQDKKQLQSFLGLVNFYRRFIPAAAKILLPLSDALRADQDWVWSPAHQGHTDFCSCPGTS